MPERLIDQLAAHGETNFAVSRVHLTLLELRNDLDAAIEAAGNHLGVADWLRKLKADITYRLATGGVAEPAGTARRQAQQDASGDGQTSPRAPTDTGETSRAHQRGSYGLTRSSD